jgi:uncharacterized protein (TIGR03437 family)
MVRTAVPNPCALAAILTLWSFLGLPAWASEADAIAISANIQARHLPFGTILDPIFSSPSSDQIASYTRCGDSALWTGAYLAAESFRYKVTRSPDALNNAKGALAGLKSLVDVTGDNRLARCIFREDSPYATGIASEEAANGIFRNPPWLWVGNTSRDQIVGAFFGLGVAYDAVDDPAVRSGVSDLVTRLIGYISRHQWSPDDDITSTFGLRPEALQMLLQVARHVNPSNPVSGPFFVLPVQTGVLVDVQSNSSYYKFNLDYMSFYHLVKLQNTSDNRNAYQVVRNYTASHQNAFFNLVDLALAGVNPKRDTETRVLLDEWLLRPKRDFKVDLAKSVPVCGGEACAPVPVPMRPPTDFLWQRSPFQLSGGGDGFIENAGIDYVLPYWMARYYGAIPTEAVVQSAAAVSTAVAPDSLASLYGTNLASTTASAGSQPLPTLLGGVMLRVTDSSGVERPAPLVYVSPTQINFLVPGGIAPGAATFSVQNGAETWTATAAVQPVAPSLFSMNGSGTGVAAATAIVTQAAHPERQSPIPVFLCDGSTCVSVPIHLGVDTPIYVTFYGTGIRNRSSLTNVQVNINGVSVPVLYAGPAPAFPGLDQVNIALELELRNAGEANVVLTVDGQKSNTVTIQVQ